MTTYTIQVTNHPEAGRRIPTEAGAASWETRYDGPLESDAAARECVNALSSWYRCARVFKGKNVGKYHYAVLR